VDHLHDRVDVQEVVRVDGHTLAIDDAQWQVGGVDMVDVLRVLGLCARLALAGAADREERAVVAVVVEDAV
jgi:hypothetical protein